ncbi:MAG: ECF transporter S component [Bacilli bacterium]
MRRSNHVLNLTFFAICSAILFIMGFIPNLGYITIGIFSITIIHLPVLLFSYLKGYRWGWLYGLMFGLTSYLVALTQGKTAFDALFASYPIVALAPRIIFGFLAGITFSVLKTCIHDRFKRKIALIPASFILTVIHSLLVFLFLYIFCKEQVEEMFNGEFWYLFYSLVFLSGTIPEAIMAAVVVPLLAWPLEPLYRRLYMNKAEDRKESQRLQGLLIARINTDRQSDIL